MSQTPKKKISKIGRPPKRESVNDYCRICKCRFKLAKCASLKIFERNERDGFSLIILGDMCAKSGIDIVKNSDFSDRVCVSCARKIRDCCSLYNEICTSINKPCVQFVETEGEARFKRQIPTDSEHSPTVRNVVKHVSAKNNETGESSGDHKKVKKSLFVTEETSVDKHNIACESTVSSLLNIDINLLNNTTEKKTSDVSVVIKHPNGDVIMRHVKDPNARSIVRNIALCNWKSAAFSIMKCEGLIDQLLNALNKKIANEFKTFSKLDSILKGRTPEELVAFSNKLLLEELRVHLPFWNACVKGSV